MNCVKSEDFKYIEECIARIKNHDDVEDNLTRIERALYRAFELNFKVSIARNDVNDFFAVNVFPGMAYIHRFPDLMAKTLIERLDPEEKLDDSAIIAEEWASCQMWFVELDHTMLYSNTVSYSPADIMSAILYEISRIVYTDTVPRLVFDRFRYAVNDTNRLVRALFQNTKIQMLMDLAIVECCQSKMFSKISDDANNTCTTMCALLTSMGYLDDYNRLVTKFISDGKTTELVYKTHVDVSKDIKVIFIWIINMIKELEFNKKRLRDAIESERLRASSDVVKTILNAINSEFFEGVTDSYRLLLSEQWNATPVDKYAGLVAFENLVKSCKRIMTEATSSVFDKNGKLKKISQLDIDIIAVDVDRIETHDDKIYVLDKIYDKLQICEAGLDYIESGDSNKKVNQSKQTLLSMKKQLEDLRRMTLATRIIEKEYGVFIKYPKGYEG